MDLRDTPRVTGLILAGGQGRRMGGVDKGLQLLRGRPMVEWVLERLAPQVSEIIVNANQNIERYEEYGHRVVRDEIGGFAGPLAGLHAGLKAGALFWGEAWLGRHGPCRMNPAAATAWRCPVGFVKDEASDGR
jgi:molybdopterin-guanine dinucleotide biosynthesis protein A